MAAGKLFDDRIAPNRAQRLAIESPMSAIAVVGPAGSGKSFSLVGRVEFLLTARGLNPSELSILTPSQSAAQAVEKELKTRMGGKCFIPATDFQLMGLAWLKRHAGYFRRESDFTIADEGDGERLLSPEAGDEWPQVLRAIRQFKRGDPHSLAAPPTLFDSYERQLQAANKFDREDLVWRPLLMAQTEEPFRRELQRSVGCLLVDDFHLLDPAQYALFRLMVSRESSRFFVTGDPYGGTFTMLGGVGRIFANLRTDFPDSSFVTLRKSINRPAVLATLAQTLFAGKRFGSRFKGHEGLVARAFSSREREIDWLRASIAEIRAKEEGTIAMLFRTRRSLTRFARFLGFPRVEGEKVGGRPFYLDSPYVELLAAWETGFQRYREGEAGLSDPLVKLFHARISIVEILQFLLPFSPLSVQQGDRLIALSELFAADYPRFQNFLAVRGAPPPLTAPQEVKMERFGDAAEIAVDHLFIPGCEEGAFPLPPPTGINPGEHLDRETRLFYQAASRARRILYLSYARWEGMEGRGAKLKPSSILLPLRDWFVLPDRSPRPKLRRQLTLF